MSWLDNHQTRKCHNVNNVHFDKKWNAYVDIVILYVWFYSFSDKKTKHAVQKRIILNAQKIQCKT